MRLYYRILRFFCQMLFVFYARGRVFGLRNVPNEGGVLLVSNHQSFLDPVLVTLALQREGNYMARDTLFRNRFFRTLIESLNAFPVKRASADLAAVKEIIRRLRDGRLVVTFPEGTRTVDGSIGPLREGAVVVARRAGCAIVPVVVDGAFECWPRTRRFPGPGSIRVAYGQMIPAARIEALSVAELIEEVRAALLRLQARHSRPSHRQSRAAPARGPGSAGISPRAHHGAESACG